MSPGPLRPWTLIFMKHTLKLITFLFLVGCSNSFQTSSEGQNDQFSNTTPTNVDIQASVSSGPFESSLVINHVRNSRLEIQIPLGMNALVPTLETQDPNLNLLGRVTADANGLKTLILSLPYNLVLQGVSLPQVSGLPTGAPLNQYFTNRDSVSHYSFNLNAEGTVRGYLYLDPPRFGFFLQSAFDPGLLRHYPVTLANSFMTLGSFSTHPLTEGQNGGMFLFISLPQ